MSVTRDEAEAFLRKHATLLVVGKLEDISQTSLPALADGKTYVMAFLEVE